MSLWRRRDFLKLWAGQSISSVGTSVTGFALPLAALLVLQAGAFDVGLLAALAMAPFVILTLPAGVWIDRLARRRPILIAADLGRALLLATVPVAALAGRLTLLQLYGVAFGTGILDLGFRLAWSAHLPTLVERAQLTDANGKLMTSYSAAEVAGPGIAGLLVQSVTAPVAIAVDAVSYLASAISIALISSPEPRLEKAVGRSALRDLIEGFQVLRQPLWRGMIGSATTLNLFSSGALALTSIFAIRELRLTPTEYGIVGSTASVGAVTGALLASWAARRFGQGRAILLAAVGFPVYLALLPLAGGPVPVAMGVLIAAGFIGGVGVMVFDVNLASLRQAITPLRMMGRSGAAITFTTQSAKPVGALLGGILGQQLGIRPTLWLMAAGGITVLAWLWPLRHGEPEITRLAMVAEQA